MSFNPPIWLRNRHLQTLGAALPLWSPPRGFDLDGSERLLLPIPGHDETHGLVARATWHPGDSEAERAARPRRTALLVHGVAGDADSQYVRRAAVAMVRAGMHAVRLNLRGAGEGMRHAPSLYHAGLTSDVEAACRALLADARVASIVLVGFSLGGNVSLCLAGEWGARPLRVDGRGVDGVVAVSPPLDLVDVSRALERKRSFPYAKYVLRGLVEEGRAFAREHPEKTRYDARKLDGLRRVRDYDDLVVVPMHGFASVDAYYRAASSGQHLPTIRVPTLIVHAEDDPMIPDGPMRELLRARSSAVDLAWSARGGHVGWFSGFGETHFVDTWAMRRAAEFVRGLA